MPKFVPRENDYVVRDEDGRTIYVIAEYQGKLVPFISNCSKVVRADLWWKGRAEIPILDLRKIIVEAGEILNEKVRNTSEKARQIYASRYGYQDGLRLSLLENYDISILTDGKILIKRHIFKQNEAYTKPSIYNDIHSAIRSQEHIIENYLDGELEIVSQIAEKVRMVHVSLCEWSGQKNWQYEKIEKEIKNAASMLFRARNYFKQEAYYQLREIHDMHDSKNRFNPSSMAARSAKAENSLEKRKMEILRFSGYAIGVKDVLQAERLEIEKNVALTRLRLKALVYSSEKVWQGKTCVFRKIKEADKLLKSAWVNPYFINARKTKKVLDKIQKSLLKDDFKLARCQTVIAVGLLNT